MIIVHQLPGRLRIRLPELQDAEFSRKLTALLSQDEKIAGLGVTPGCYSLTLYYDPLQITYPEIMAALQTARDKATGPEETASPGVSQQETCQVPDWESPEDADSVSPPTGAQDLETSPPPSAAGQIHYTQEASTCSQDSEEGTPVLASQELSLDGALEEAQSDVQEKAPPEKKVRKARTKEGDKKRGPSKRAKKTNSIV